MTEQVPNDLIGGGDCFLHYHSEDRKPTQDLLQGLQGVASQVPLSGVAQLRGSEDFIAVDTSSSDATITLPKAINGREIEIMKLYPTYTITFLPQGTDTILNTAGATLSTGNASLRFKAIGTDWRII
jgi:hypothetical protein